jgi:hypothetical protein
MDMPLILLLGGFIYLFFNIFIIYYLRGIMN